MLFFSRTRYKRLLTRPIVISVYKLKRRVLLFNPGLKKKHNLILVTLNNRTVSYNLSVIIFYIWIELIEWPWKEFDRVAAGHASSRAHQKLLPIFDKTPLTAAPPARAGRDRDALHEKFKSFSSPLCNLKMKY